MKIIQIAVAACNDTGETLYALTDEGDVMYLLIGFEPSTDPATGKHYDGITSGWQRLSNAMAEAIKHPET